MSRGIAVRGGILAAMVIAATVTSAVPAVAAVQTHAFDPRLSLTGDCSTGTLDSVPDPGCPGGAHPSSAFALPKAITTDQHGNIYVASWGKEANEGRIDVFDPEGFFITEVAAPGSQALAVDSQGNLYVAESVPGSGKVVRYPPSAPYEPTVGNIKYTDPPVLVRETGASVSVAVNPENDHLFIETAEYSSAESGNVLLSESIVGSGILHPFVGSLAVDASRNLLYVGDYSPETSQGLVRVFDLQAPHALLKTFDGTGSPAGEFGAAVKVAVDESSGDFFVFDAGEFGAHIVYAYGEEGDYLETIGQGIVKEPGKGAQIWVDNGVDSPNGGQSSEGRYLFVPSHPVGIGHSFAFGPSSEVEPVVESLAAEEVTRNDAELVATVNPGNLATSYRFEYTTLENYDVEEFASAKLAGEGQVPVGKTGRRVSAVAGDLAPGTAYRFRVVAENELGKDEAEGGFTTYLETAPGQACPNDALRTGPSALLPDCRAYELVTPADTNARSPIGLGHLGVYFPTRESSPDGSKVSFQVEGGAIPGYEGTGSLGGDPYLATRSADGWTTTAAGPSGAEAKDLLPGSVSPDQGYSFWGTAGPGGSAAIDDKSTFYVRYPDGHSDLIGVGSIATDPHATGKLISEDGEHIVFYSGNTGAPAIKLEPNAPSGGTKAIYDRTADGVTHVVSLLPGDVTPADGQAAIFQGASLDGEGIAFEIGGTLYLRYRNETTYQIGAGLTFAGVTEGGRRVFYLQGGNLKAFDVDEGVIPFTTSGDVTPVNVAALGAVAYFLSPTVLAGGANPNGETPQAGAENLYLSDQGEISFVGTVTEVDAEGGTGVPTGLGRWIFAVGGAEGAPGRFGFDPSRTTPDGSAMVFESRANLTDYDSEGTVQVYRYDLAAAQLECLSCNPTGGPPRGGGTLQSLSLFQWDPEPLVADNLLANLRADGRRVFFQAKAPLVREDSDGLQDVYEWEAEGVGSCTRPGGCVSLISSGNSALDDYLYAISDSGDDVFFHSGDLLAPAFDSDTTPSIYDARVRGGFAPPAAAAGECLGEACQPAASAPNDPTPASSVYRGAGNVSPEAGRRHCPKGRRAVRRGGKVRCAKKKKHAKHKRTHNHRRAGR
ncbi:MAG TPA: hypothetical protein VFN18_02510 [Solirubrobacterales bacterium]|nr:hypothetical protein [Solirubrobacterales bacterium]